MECKPPTGARETMHVRGNVSLEKYKAARTMAGGQVKFELRAIRPGSSGARGPTEAACIVCIICIICVVCSIVTANELGLPQLTPL